MQFNRFIKITTLMGLIALTFGTRLLNRNLNKEETSVFAQKNFKVKESEVLDDLMEQNLRRTAMSRMRIKNPKSKYI